MTCPRWLLGSFVFCCSLAITQFAITPVLAADPAGHTDADYARHIEALKKRLPADDFTIVIEKPFVVVGNEAAAMVRARSQKTVRWAVDLLMKQYFAKYPDHIITVWLFRDKETYETFATKLFGSKPTTPYGYYTSAHKALVMNISTGGGTLVHEIVHPFVAANFPACPSWFNEGLASLYEQSQEKEGKIWGLPNWRLPGLQKAITAGKLPTFAELCSTSTDEFYRSGSGYPQSRYLCLYLQEKGLLAKFYQEFSTKAKDDPTGYHSLQKVLGEKDMDDFQKRWQKYVLELKR